MKNLMQEMKHLQTLTSKEDKQMQLKREIKMKKRKNKKDMITNKMFLY
jgi:hypothetical protein